MNAQEMLLNYAKTRNDGSRLTDQQWLGQAIAEGIVFERTPSSRTAAHIKREGKTIIVTEILTEKTHETVDGRIVFDEKRTSTEIFRVDV